MYYMYTADKRYSAEIKIWDFAHIFTLNRPSNNLFSSPQINMPHLLINVQAVPLALIAMIYALSSSLISPNCCILVCTVCTK